MSTLESSKTRLNVVALSPQGDTKAAEGSAPTVGGEGTLVISAPEGAPSAPAVATTTDVQDPVIFEAGTTQLDPNITTPEDAASTGKAASAATDEQETSHLQDRESVRESIHPASVDEDSIRNQTNSPGASLTDSRNLPTRSEPFAEGPTRPEIPRIFPDRGDNTKNVVSDNLTRFGDRDDYWINYDKLTKKFDEDIMGRLNSNLENLLIFAGLFSAVNSAFIILVLSSFIHNPVDDTNTILGETNALLRMLVPNSDTITAPTVVRSSPVVHSTRAIRQLCVFFASLALSLACAFGAVLAKQWLQFYEHTGQLARADKKGRARTERYYGAESWGLRVVVEALPTLLLISLALFFGALADYLWTINEPAAITVTAFAAVLALFYCLTVIMAAIFPHCPFQTAPAVGLRHLYQRVRRLIGWGTSPLFNATSRRKPRWRGALSEVKEHSWIFGLRTSVREMRASVRPIHVLLRQVRNVLRQIRSSTRLWASCKNHAKASITSIRSADYFSLLSLLTVIPLTLRIWIREGYRQAGETDKDITHAQSALWIMETAQDHEHLLAVAKNVTALDKWDAVWILHESKEFPTLLSRFHFSLIVLQRAHKLEVEAGPVPQVGSTVVIQSGEKSRPDRQQKTNPVGAALETALSFARAVAHIILTDPDPHCWLSEVRQALVDPMDLKWESPDWLRSKDLMIFCSFILRLSETDAEHIRDSFKLLKKQGFDTDNLSQFTAITFIRYCILSRRLPEIIKYADMRIAGNLTIDNDNEMEWAIQILDLGQPDLSDALLSMTSLAIISALRSPSTTLQWQTRRWKARETAQWAWLTRSGVSEDVIDNVLDALAAYHEYFKSLRKQGRQPSRWLLACHKRLLIHLNKLNRSSLRALVYEHERHIATAELLKSLLASIFLVDGRSLGWEEERLVALQECKKQLRLSLILTKREIRQYKYSDGAPHTRSARRTLPVAEDGALEHLLELYVAVADGSSALKSWIDSQPEDRHITDLMLALSLDPGITFDMVNELTLRLLFINATDPHRSTLPSNPQRDPTAVYDILSGAHLGIELTRMLSHHVAAGASEDDFDWWPIIWLLEDARRCAAAAKQLHVEEAGVQSLFGLASRMLDGEGSYGWRTTRRKLIVAWLVETWASSLRRPSLTKSTWMSDYTILDFSTNVYYFDHYANDQSITVSESSPYDGNESFKWDIDINHNHTFHFIEHAVQDNPQAAIDSHLDQNCEDFLQIVAHRRLLRLGRTMLNGDEAQDPEEMAVQRARDALDSLQAFKQQNIGWSYPCRTCHPTSTPVPKHEDRSAPSTTSKRSRSGGSIVEALS